MRKTEQKLWDRMRGRRPFDVRLERIENVAGVGTPDVCACAEGVVSWVELKAVDALPVRPSSAVLTSSKRLSVEQVNWHRSWEAAGGTSFILVGIAQDQLMLPGRVASIVNNLCFVEMANVCLAATWSEVFEVLRGKQSVMGNTQ